MEFDGDTVLARHDAHPVHGRLGDLGRAGVHVEFCRLELPRHGPKQRQHPDDAPQAAAQRLKDTGADGGGGVVHAVLIARGKLKRVGDDHRLTVFDHVDRNKRGIQRGHVVAVAQFRGNSTVVFESHGVLVGVEDTDGHRGGISRAKRRVEQGGQDSGNRISGVQRGVELG